MLQHRARSALAGLAVALATALAAPASRAADPAPPVNVIVIDTQRIMQESKAGKAIETQVQNRMKSYQQNIAKQEKDLEASQIDLQKQQTILAQDAFQAKVKEFEGRIGEARRKAQEQQREIMAGGQEATRQLQVAMLQLIADITKERNANLVLDKAAVLLFDTKFELTDEVMKRLDEKMPSFTVSFPAPGQAPAAQAPAAGNAAGQTAKKPATGGTTQGGQAQKPAAKP